MIVETKLAHPCWGPKKVMDWLRRERAELRRPAILDPTVIAEILAQFGLPIRASPRSPARRPDLLHAA